MPFGDEETTEQNIPSAGDDPSALFAAREAVTGAPTGRNVDENESSSVLFSETRRTRIPGEGRGRGRGQGGCEVNSG